jgi:hypothetical protein
MVETIMEAKIVAAFGRQDEVDDLISYLENLTRPGMTVILLVRYPLESWPYLRDHWVTTESVQAARERGREIIERHSWQTQRELAERKFAAVREALAKKGVEVEVSFYTSGLKAALLEYSADPEVFWIVRPTSTGQLWPRIVEKIVAPLGAFRSKNFPPSWSLFRVAHRRGS